MSHFHPQNGLPWQHPLSNQKTKAISIICTDMSTNRKHSVKFSLVHSEMAGLSKETIKNYYDGDSLLHCKHQFGQTDRSLCDKWCVLVDQCIWCWWLEWGLGYRHRLIKYSI